MKNQVNPLAILRVIAILLTLFAVSSLLAQEISEPARPTRLVTNAQTTNFITKSTGAGSAVTDSIMFDTGTRIGVNTNDPKNLFHVFGTANQDVFMGLGPDPSAAGPAMNFGYSGSSFGVGSGFFNVRPNGAAVAPNPSLRFSTVNVQRMIITNTGNVGIGNLAPAFTLDVTGTGHFTGAVTVDGNLAAKYQDVAEWVTSGADLTAGTVVIIDTAKSNEVLPSNHSYDTRVAGVVSAQPGLSLGVEGEGKYKIATLGRVRVKVDATKTPIAVGDLLVTSDVPGLAMKSTPVSIGDVKIHKPGTLLGKALEPLNSGKGEILVLLSLQ